MYQENTAEITRIAAPPGYMRLLDSPSGKVELSSVVASSSDDMGPMMAASGASSSTTSIFVTSSAGKYPGIHKT